MTTLLHDLVACSEAVGATRSRKLKAEALAEVLRKLDASEVASAVGFLIGQPTQGKIGVGWATLADVSVAPAAEPTLHIADIDRMLDQVAAIEGEGSQGERRGVLAGVLERATAGEADFIRRLLIGEMRQGALAGLMVDGLAKASGMPAAVIRRAAMLTGDLAVVAEVALTSDRAAVEAIGLEVMRPLQPMLASTAADTTVALEEVGEASVEWKLDGIRIQVHRNGDDVLIVTRNLNEVTGRLPGLVELVRSLPAESLVLDGEALVMSGDGPDAFQDTASTFSRESDEPRPGLDVRFFDLLHRDGQDLIDIPLIERRTQLGEIAPDLLIPGVITNDPAEAARVFDDAISAGHEGVMVKAADSPYEAGRRGKSWRKVKPVHTFDLVVLAAEWGHGRRQGWLSNLHLGARDPNATLEQDRFVMVGKTFKGLTDELLTWQTERFQEIAVRQGSRQERGAVFVRPEIVVEIALDGVQRSTRYGGGVALRFARVRRYREDKNPAEADTIDSLRALLG